MAEDLKALKDQSGKHRLWKSLRLNGMKHRSYLISRDQTQTDGKLVYSVKTRKFLTGSRGQSDKKLRFELVLGKRVQKAAYTRMKYETFIGPIPSGHGVRPIDGDQTNYALSNLALFTAATMPQKAHTQVGKRVPIIATCERTGEVKEFDSVSAACEALNFWGANVNRVLAGTRKAAAGYTFAYKPIEPMLDEEDKPEQWLPLATADPLYVSSIRNVCRLARLVGPPHQQVFVPVTLKPLQRGYIDAKSKNGKHVPLHRLIWHAFGGQIPDGWEIDHKDKNPLNNAIDNLQVLPRGHHARKDHGVAVTVNGCKYGSIIEAAEANGVSSVTLRTWISSGKNGARRLQPEEWHMPINSTKRRREEEVVESSKRQRLSSSDVDDDN